MLALRQSSANRSHSPKTEDDYGQEGLRIDTPNQVPPSATHYSWPIFAVQHLGASASACCISSIVCTVTDDHAVATAVLFLPPPHRNRSYTWRSISIALYLTLLGLSPQEMPAPPRNQVTADSTGSSFFGGGRSHMTASLDRLEEGSEGSSETLESAGAAVASYMVRLAWQLSVAGSRELGCNG